MSAWYIFSVMVSKLRSETGCEMFWGSSAGGASGPVGGVFSYATMHCMARCLVRGNSCFMPAVNIWRSSSFLYLHTAQSSCPHLALSYYLPSPPLPSLPLPYYLDSVLEMHDLLDIYLGYLTKFDIDIYNKNI